ncbi:MAG: RNase H family protein [Deltaproteobacteria bacterium]|nr:RNase H family protein [Myxococcales bacterium]MDP3220948.1 RNase H family protein [Deltaproteobacteria bacterium]
MNLVAYTDGSGTMAHLPCGAGVVVYDDGVPVLEASRPLGLGTNNHAELSAIRVALAITDDWRHRPLTIRTDSEYCLGVLTAPRGPRSDQKNGRLIHLIRLAMEGRDVVFEFVKGHAKIEGNERADKLAGLARKRQQVAVRPMVGAP